jgi:hypothetical protein
VPACPTIALRGGSDAPSRATCRSTRGTPTPSTTARPRHHTQEFRPCQLRRDECRECPASGLRSSDRQDTRGYAATEPTGRALGRLRARGHIMLPRWAAAVRIRCRRVQHQRLYAGPLGIGEDAGMAAFRLRRPTQSWVGLGPRGGPTPRIAVARTSSCRASLARVGATAPATSCRLLEQRRNDDGVLGGVRR